MDKMLAEYSVKRRDNRWPLAFYYNMIGVAALAAYVIYSVETLTEIKFIILTGDFCRLVKSHCFEPIDSRNS
jgi:hypothetical protein